MKVKRYQDTKYLIYNDSRVQNEETGTFLKSFDNGKGYQKVILHIDGKRRSRYVHRLVAEQFIRKPRKRYCDQVNHIDGDKTNNHHTNLEWVTNGENQKHAYKIGLK